MEQDDPQSAKRGWSHWLATWNNYPSDWWLQLQAIGASFISAQREISSTGTPHIQFYIHLERPVSRAWLTKKLRHCSFFGKIPGAAKDVYAYCTPDKCGNPEKQKTVVPDSHVEYGKKPNFTACVSKTKPFEDTLASCRANCWEQSCAEHQVKYLGNLVKLTAHYSKPISYPTPRGIWITGPPGSGKSYYARTHYGASGYYLKGQNKWWDNYAQESTVILDDLDFSGACLSHLLKIWLDQYGVKQEIKGATVALNYERFIITSNYTIEELWPGDQHVVLRNAITRRCRVIQFMDREVVSETDYTGQNPAIPPAQDPFHVALMNFVRK